MQDYEQHKKRFLKLCADLSDISDPDPYGLSDEEDSQKRQYLVANSTSRIHKLVDDVILLGEKSLYAMVEHYVNGTLEINILPRKHVSSDEYTKTDLFYGEECDELMAICATHPPLVYNFAKESVTLAGFDHETFDKLNSSNISLRAPCFHFQRCDVVATSKLLETKKPLPTRVFTDCSISSGWDAHFGATKYYRFVYDFFELALFVIFQCFL